jgi:hypothetical protein
MIAGVDLLPVLQPEKPATKSRGCARSDPLVRRLAQKQEKRAEQPGRDRSNRFASVPCVGCFVRLSTQDHAKANVVGALRR